MADNTFSERWLPGLSLLVNPQDPTESIQLSGQGDPRQELATLMPPPDALTDNDWAHLVTGAPKSKSVAGEEVTPSDSAKLGDDDWSHLVTGKPAGRPQPAQPETVAESVKQSREQGRGVTSTVQEAMRTLVRQHPQAASAIGATAALNTGIPLAGAAAMGFNALPLWAQMVGGYLGYKAGIPEEAHSLWNLIRESVPH